MRELTVRLTLTLPDDMTDDKALSLLSSIIAIGQADAEETASYDDEGDNEEAKLAASVEISDPEVATLYK